MMNLNEIATKEHVKHCISSLKSDVERLAVEVAIKVINEVFGSKDVKESLTMNEVMTSLRASRFKIEGYLKKGFIKELERTGKERLFCARSVLEFKRKGLETSK